LQIPKSNKGSLIEALKKLDMCNNEQQVDQTKRSVTI